MSKRKLTLTNSDRCMGCCKPSFTLYCDECAPPRVTLADAMDGQVRADRHWNGEPMEHDNQVHERRAYRPGRAAAMA